MTVQYPEYVGVKIGRTAIIPAEFCEVRPAQVYRKKIAPVGHPSRRIEAQRRFLEFATQRPERRFADIKSAVAEDNVCAWLYTGHCGLHSLTIQKVFNYTDSDYMQEAGMLVNPEPMELRGKVITPPPIKYGSNHIIVSHTRPYSLKQRH